MKKKHGGRVTEPKKHEVSKKNAAVINDVASRAAMPEQGRSERRKKMKNYRRFFPEDQ